MRSPPCPSCGACQKCCWPVPNSVPTEAKLAMWPPSSSSLLLAFATSTIAFQRQIERMRSSSVTSPGERSSRCVGMVLMYAVFAENGMYAPERRALSISRSSRKCARSGPSRSSTASSASSHSWVSSESGSLAAGNCGTADIWCSWACGFGVTGTLCGRGGAASLIRSARMVNCAPLMAARILDGKSLAAQVRASVKAEVVRLAQRGVRPGLAVILAGDDPASRVYVRNKTRACEETGVRSQQIDYPASVTQEELIGRINKLNADPV